MSDEDRNGYADDQLRMNPDTDAEEIHDFVEKRACNPHEIEDITVWNFSTHVVDREAIERKTYILDRDRYFIPYQVTPVWGYMNHILPEEIRSAGVLVYKRDLGHYRDYPNYLKASAAEERKEVREDILQCLEGDDEGRS